MKAETRLWVEKAESDYEAAIALARKRTKPLHDQVCFHCQQSAEKYIKAYLTEKSLAFSKIHDLPALMTLVTSVDVSLGKLSPQADFLTDFAVDYRYPGIQAVATEAGEAIKSARLVRASFRKYLGLIPPRRKRK